MPATPGQVTGAGATLQGTIDTHLLSAPDTWAFIFHLTGNAQSGISGYTNPDAVFGAARANIWLNGHTLDAFTLGNGLEDGYGNEFNTAPDGSLYMTAGFTPGSPLSYAMAANAWVSLYGQGAGASASARSRITLLGISAVNQWGNVSSSAVFDQQGNGYFTASTPEPTSLVLLGSGLVGLVPFVRRRRT